MYTNTNTNNEIFILWRGFYGYRLWNILDDCAGKNLFIKTIFIFVFTISHLSKTCTKKVP